MSDPLIVAAISCTGGAISLAAPPAGRSPGLSVENARIGLQWGDGGESTSWDWELTRSQPLSGDDPMGAYRGLALEFSCQDRLGITWQCALYPDRPAAAVWMAVVNRSAEDQFLLRLSALRADPRDGGRVDAGVQADQALILNNGLWMDTPPAEWRLPVPEDRFHQGYWSVGVGAPVGPALIAGIGEPASSCAGIGILKHAGQLGLDVGGWLWADTAQRPLRLKPGQAFALQRMLLMPAAGMQAGLAAYADLAGGYAGARLRFPPYAGIFSAYGGDRAGEHPEQHPLTEARIDELRRVVDAHLKPYGLDTFKTQFAGLSSGPPGMVGQRRDWTGADIAPAGGDLVERVYQSGFTPDVYDSRRDFPGGIEAHVRDLKRRGYRPALVCRPFLNIRSGPPEYDQLAADLFAMAVERWGYEYLMFDFNSDDYETADDTHTLAEGIRRRFQAVRDRVGPGVFIEACMVTPGPVLGIADGFRHACDWRGGAEDQLARQAAARYYYHGRWFQLDHEFFDPQMRPFTWGDQGRQGMLASLDRVRLWTSFGALTGFSWLTGGVIETVSPERWRIFSRALPVYGRCARPVDLLEGDPPAVWLLDAAAAGQEYQVLGLFNWTDEPRWFDRSLADLGIPAPGGHLLFDFWEQRLAGPQDGVCVELAPWSCKVYIVRRPSADPMWVGTDRHVTGAVGLRRLAYDPGADCIEGECEGPAGSTQSHYIRLPYGAAPESISGSVFEAPQFQVIKVTTDLGEAGRASWRMRLQRGRQVT